MKISVITINYNNVLGLQKTLQSVKEQTYNNYEYIVIDGYSNDGSQNIIEQYRNIISKYVSEKDTGVFNAMNKGIAFANGDYCIFLNSGDYFADKYVLEKAEEYLNDADFVSGDTICVDNKGNKKFWGAPKILSCYIIIRYALSHQSTFIKTELLKRRPYREDLRIASDWEQELYEIVFHDATYKYLPLVVSIFNDEGMSRKNLDKVKEERLKIYNEYFSKRLLKYSLGDNELKELCSHAEEGTLLYNCMLYSVKIARKVYGIFSFFKRNKLKI